MRTNAKNIIALFLCAYVFVLFFFGLLNTKSIKLVIIPDDIKFKHIYIYMETSHIYI